MGFGWMHNGTTVAIGKKGSGIAKALDGCLASFMESREFLNTCKIMHGEGASAHSQISTCVPNTFFYDDADYVPDDIHHSPYMFGTSAMKAGHHNCSTGFCNCEEEA